MQEAVAKEYGEGNPEGILPLAGLVAQMREMARKLNPWRTPNMLAQAFDKLKARQERTGEASEAPCVITRHGRTDKNVISAVELADCGAGIRRTPDVKRRGPVTLTPARRQCG